MLETAKNEALEAVLLFQNIVETIDWTLDYQDLLIAKNKDYKTEALNTKITQN